MCGIAGIIDFSKTFPEKYLDDMLLSMTTRGPRSYRKSVFKSLQNRYESVINN